VLLVLWDPHLELFMLNRQAEEVLGYSTVEANEGDFMRRVYPDDAYREKVAAYMQALEPGWREWVVTAKDGEEVPIEWANIRLSDNTRIGIGVDLRERKMAEAALHESNNELNEYTYALTHNIKAPFRAVQNYANFLLEDLADALDSEPKKFLDGIKKAVSLANKQFEDLEALYSVKDHPLEFEAFDMRELLDEIAALHDGMRERDLVIEAQWPPLWGERFLLRQILMALVINGLKYNESETKRVEVTWRHGADRRFEIIVRDNGIGIDPRYHEKIFRIFQRLHTEQEYEGTGIGLAVVRKAVKRLGGEVRIESAVGEGSTFVLSLPATMLKSASEHNG
jgi:PAS domain S-box-containing protein